MIGWMSLGDLVLCRGFRMFIFVVERERLGEMSNGRYESSLEVNWIELFIYVYDVKEFLVSCVVVFRGCGELVVKIGIRFVYFYFCYGFYSLDLI